MEHFCILNVILNVLCGICYSELPSIESFCKELFCNEDKQFMIYGKFRHFLRWDIPLVMLQSKRGVLPIFRHGEKELCYL
jgi:hypothetical protein